MTPKINKAQILAVPAMYYLAFGLYSIGAFLELTTFYNVFGVTRDEFVALLQVFVLMFLFVKFLTQKASLSGWCCAIIAVFVGFMSWRQGGEGWFFWLVLFIICSDGVNLKTLAGITLGIVSALSLFTVLCCNLGLIENRIFFRDTYIRYAWGFKHPNNFGSYLLLLCVCFSTLRFGRNPWPDILLVSLTLVVNLVLLDSRSSALLAIVQIVLLIIFYIVKSPRKKRCWSLIFAAGMAAVILGSLYFMINYSSANSFHRVLNDLMSLRLSLANGYYSMQPLTLFGDDFVGFAPIYWENGQAAVFIVDNAFCHLLLRFGIISLVLFVVSLMVLLHKLIKTQSWNYLLFGIVLMTIYGMGETLGIRVECNFFLIAIGTELIFASKSKLMSVGEKRVKRGKVLAKDNRKYKHA